MTIPGMWGIERFGRRPLLIWGAVVMCICEYLVAIIGVTISVTNTSGQKALVALVFNQFVIFKVSEVFPAITRFAGAR